MMLAVRAYWALASSCQGSVRACQHQPHEVIQANLTNTFQKGVYGLEGRAVR